MDLRSLSDEALMEHVQQGSRPAYETLFTRHKGAVFGLLVRRTRNRERANDLFQETWLRVHRGRHTYKTGQRVKPWLMGIALNTARDAGRKDQRTIDTVEMTMDRPAMRSDHAARMTLEQAIADLPPNLKDAFLLGAVHGLDHNEVAARLDISPANARARISRARKNLRDKLT